MSVKKSILDGRLLPGKSVLIPGLILDQRLRQNYMPLGLKMNTFSAVEIGWKCVRLLALTGLFFAFCARGGVCVAAVNEAEQRPPDSIS